LPSRVRLFSLIGVNQLEHFRYNYSLRFGHNGENAAVEMHRAALVTVIIRANIIMAPLMQPEFISLLQAIHAIA